MFCSNCGQKLPEGSKFCPNCGAAIVTGPVPAQDAGQSVWEVPLQPEAAPVPEETKTVTVPVSEEPAETATAETENVQIPEEEVSVPYEDAVVPEAEEAAVEPETPAAEPQDAEKVTAQAKEAPVISEDEVTQPQYPVPDAAPAEETAEKSAPEIQPEIPAQDEAPVMPQEPVPAAPVVAPVPVFPSVSEAPAEDNALPDTEPAAVYTVPNAGTPADSGQSPYSNADTGDSPEKGGKKRGGSKTAIIAIVLLALIAGGILIYRNLPETRFKRYMKNALEAYTGGDFITASEQYQMALEIHPDSEEALMNIEDMYDIVLERAYVASAEGRFEEGVQEARSLQKIKPDDEVENNQALYDAYSLWVMDLVENGTREEAEALISRAQEELSSGDIEQIRNNAEIVYQLKDLEHQLTLEAEALAQPDEDMDIISVFAGLEYSADIMQEYRSLGGTLPYVVLNEDGRSGTEFNMNDKGNVQVYIGELVAGRIKSGHGRTYFISGRGSDSASYEFFESDWTANDPSGTFLEYDYSGSPDSKPTGVISGVLYNGYYNGSIVNQRGDHTYNMKFSYGKVEVLDTTDPNGDRNNVVGYTDDKNNWLIFSDSALNSKYGVRYLR